MFDFPQLSAFRGGNGKVRVIGHRGAREIMPENTIEGFEFTLSLGVKALEFDVLLTADQVPVITHNHRVSAAATRNPDGQWLQGIEPKVATLSLAQLQELDVGGLDGRTRYGQKFSDQAFLNGVRVPSLTALLELVTKTAYLDVFLMLELKSDPLIKEKTHEYNQLVSAVVALLREYDVSDRTVLHSFDWDMLKECRRQAPDIPTSYLSQASIHEADKDEHTPDLVHLKFIRKKDSLPKAIAEAGGQLWCPHFADVTSDLVDEAHAIGLLVSTWTVNKRNDILSMISAGVDGIVTDHPGRVQRCLLERGLHW